jgi:putative transposase
VIEAEKAEFPVALMCRALGVSRSGFYAWSVRPESERSKENKRLTLEIKKVHEESRRTYGSPRVHAELQEQGFEVGRKRVARLMRDNGLRAKGKRRFRKTTDSNHGRSVAPNILSRNFEVDAPNTVWAGDITYLWTAEGWVYLAVVLDLFSRRVVGWALADHMRTDLVLEALFDALGSRAPRSGLLHHSDRGTQYASGDYQATLEAHGIKCSMSRTGDCWDNAVVESFFGTLKTELDATDQWTTRAQARYDVFEYVEVFYNRQRRHSYLGYVSPARFEAEAMKKTISNSRGDAA